MRINNNGPIGTQINIERIGQIGQIAEIGRIGQIDIDIHDPGTVSCLADAVRRRERVDDDAAEEIRDALSETPDLPEEVRVVVREEKEPKTFWEKLRPYLGDAEKLTKILQAAGPVTVPLIRRGTVFVHDAEKKCGIPLASGPGPRYNVFSLRKEL